MAVSLSALILFLAPLLLTANSMHDTPRAKYLLYIHKAELNLIV